MTGFRRITIYLDAEHAALLDDAQKMAPDMALSPLVSRLIRAGVRHFSDDKRLDLEERAKILEKEAEQLRQRAADPRRA